MRRLCVGLWWPPILGVATLASLALHIAFGHQAFMAGLIVDIVVLSVLIRRASPGVRFRDLTARLPKHPALARTGTVATVLVLAYAATARPARAP